MYTSVTENRIYPVNHSAQHMVPVQAAANTLDTGAALTRKCMKTSLVYLGVTIFCVVFCLIYEQFSFGEYSDAMRLMFLVPLIGGALPFQIFAMRRKAWSLSRAAYNLWNSGLAVLMSGCLVKGIIEVSGRVSDYDMFYWVGGAAFLIAAIAVQLKQKRK